MQRTGVAVYPRSGWGTGIRTPIDGSKVHSPAVRRSPIEEVSSPPRCRDPDLNWGHQHFQCCALPTELSRLVSGKRSACGRPLRERAMRFELTTFSLARRRSTAELRPHARQTNFCCSFFVFTLLCRTTLTLLGRCLLQRWTRSDSNRRSSPCKGDAFPLGHGPTLDLTTWCRREDSNLHT